MRWNSRTSSLLLPSYFSLPDTKGTFLGALEMTLLTVSATFSFKTFSISSAPKFFPVFLPMKTPFSIYAAVRSMTNVWYTLWKRFPRKLEGDWGSWRMSLAKYPQWGDRKVALDLQRKVMFGSEPASDTKSKVCYWNWQDGSPDSPFQLT